MEALPSAELSTFDHTHTTQRAPEAEFVTPPTDISSGLREDEIPSFSTKANEMEQDVIICGAQAGPIQCPPLQASD
jgi:hypothetical protein